MNKQNFIKNIITTIGGTSVALLVSLLATPILSRLYEPSDFGHLAVYLSIISTAAIVSTCRYELAIVIPKQKSHAAYLVIASIMLATLLSLSMCIFNMSIWLLNPDFSNHLMSPIVFILILPIGLLILSAVQTLTCWQIRLQDFKIIAKARVVQSLSLTITQLALGMANPVSLALIIGHILGGASLLICITRRNMLYIFTQIKTLKFLKLRVMMSRYSDLPKYLIVGHLANTLSSQMPVILFAAMYGPKYAGFYAMAERLVVLPIAVIASSVGEVFRSSSAIEYQRSKNCLPLFLKLKARLAILAIFAATVIYILAPYAFPYILGDSWHKSGEVAVLLSALVFFQTISSPLSQVVYLASMYQLDLIWQIFRLVGSILSIYIGYSFYNDFLISVRLYVLVLCITYICHSYMQLIAAKGAHTKKQSGSNFGK